MNKTDNKKILKMIKSLKNNKKLKTYSKIPDIYNFKDVNYKSLKPREYTILKKKTIIVSKIKGKIVSKNELNRGDFVICNSNGETYGLNLEKVINNYDLGNIINKKITRKGTKLTSKNLKKFDIEKKENILITPSWGGIQNLNQNDYLLMETDYKKIYGIDEKTFLKTYK